MTFWAKPLRTNKHGTRPQVFIIDKENPEKYEITFTKIFVEILSLSKRMRISYPDFVFTTNKLLNCLRHVFLVHQKQQTSHIFYIEFNNIHIP